MLTEKKITKVAYLIKRAVSINEDLLSQERELVKAISEHRDFDYLKLLSEKVNILMRKEMLFNQAALTVLQTEK